MTGYLVRINGVVPVSVLESVARIGDVRPAGTVIEVDLDDDAALAGLLSALRSAGVELLEVHRRSSQTVEEA
jgi:hypothetical protein